MTFVKLMVVQELDPLQDDRLEIACGLAHKLGSDLVGITAVDLLDSFSYDKVIAPGMLGVGSLEESGGKVLRSIH